MEAALNKLLKLEQDIALLDLSIAHHKDINCLIDAEDLNRLNIELCSTRCPLCQHYNYTQSSRCVECPIFFHTKKTGCKGTPYMGLDECAEELTERAGMGNNIKDISIWYDMFDFSTSEIEFLNNLRETLVVEFAALKAQARS